MNDRVLFVDDEPNVLAGIRRALRGKVDLTTSESPVEALELLRREDAYAVIVSDMRMPEMDGVEFLKQARTIAPDSVRLMLTGNADQKTAVDAVNDGEVFRFLNKPCGANVLHKTLTAAFRQYELVTLEKELLGNTLNGSIKILADVLSITSPEAFGRTNRIRERVLEIGDVLGDVSEWELDTAASLCLLGCVALRSELLEKVLAGDSLDKSERAEYEAHPLLAAELITQIPRMHGVANTILYQHKNFDGSGFPQDDANGEKLPIGARILRVVLDYDELASQGWSDAAIYERLTEQAGRYDPDVLAALGKCLDECSSTNIARIPIGDLRNGMTIREDVKTSAGVLLVCEGQVVTTALQNHLQKFVSTGVLETTVLVDVPNTPATTSAA